MLSAIAAEAIVKEFSAGLVSILSLRESNPPISAGLKAASSTAASSPHDALGARVALRGTLDTPDRPTLQPRWHGRPNSLQEPTNRRSSARPLRGLQQWRRCASRVWNVKAVRGSAKERWADHPRNLKLRESNKSNLHGHRV